MSSILLNMRVSKIAKTGNAEVITLVAPNANLNVTITDPEQRGVLKSGQNYHVNIEQDLHEGPPRREPSEPAPLGRAPERAEHKTASEQPETGPARNKTE